jgi:hypothetical protein
MRRSGIVRVVVGTAALLAATTGQAGEARLGAQGGLSRATLGLADLEAGLDQEWRSGYDAGLRFELPFGEKLALVVATSLVERGGSVPPAPHPRLRRRAWPSAWTPRSVPASRPAGGWASRSGPTTRGRREAFGYGRGDVLAGAGGLRSTVADQLVYAAAALGHGPSPVTDDIATCLVPRLEPPGTAYQVGLAWFR